MYEKLFAEEKGKEKPKKLKKACLRLKEAEECRDLRAKMARLMDNCLKNLMEKEHLVTDNNSQEIIRFILL